VHSIDGNHFGPGRRARRWGAIDAGLIGAALVALFVILPLWQPGLPGTADAPIHYYRTLEFAASFTPDTLYPRWAPHLAYGYGVPYWVFVPPLPYVLPLPLWAVGLSLEASLKGSVMLTTLLYAVGAYLFVRTHLGRAAGVVAAATYTLAPFALREVLLYGGNYPQYLAIGLFPWVLWSAGRLARSGGWHNVVLTSLCFGAVLLSHLFHALVLAPVGGLYCLLAWWISGRSARRLATIVVAFGLGLAVTAFFWLPALVEREWTHAVEERYLGVSPLTVRFLDLRELLAFPQPLDAASANPWVPFALGPVVLLLAVLGVLAVVRWRRRAAIAAPGLFCLLVVLAGAFMTLPQSQWLWLNVPLLAVAEFPWRLLGLVNLGLAFLAGAACLGAATLPSPTPIGREADAPSDINHSVAVRRLRGAFPVLATLAVLAGSTVYLYPARPFDHYGERLADLAGYELTTRTIGLTTLGEYVPRWVEKMPTSSPLAEAMLAGASPAELEKLDRDNLPAGANAVLIGRTASSETYQLESAVPFQMRLRTFYFPGWQANLDGQPVPITMEPGTGLITVTVPAGSHELHVWFGNTPLRTASDAVSAIAVAGLVLVSLWRGASGLARRRHRTSAPPSPPNSLFTPRRDGDSPPTQDAGETAGEAWSLRGVAAVLLVVLMLKMLVIDPHTNWFRRHSPPGHVIGAQHALRIDLDGRFWLLGYDLDRDRVAQGDALQVVLYWQAQQLTSTNYRPFVHLDAPTDQRTWAISDNFHPGDATAQIELPTGTWDTLRYVRDEHHLLVPPAVPPVTFNLRVGLYDPGTGLRVPLADGSGDTITLQTVQVTPGRGLEIDDVPNQVDYRLGDAIWLRGYSWDPAGRELTLFWQAERPARTAVVVFVHLMDDHDRLAWGADTPPLGDLYPATDWLPGTLVADPRVLDWGDLPSGEYTLAVGMYEADTLTRLPLRTAGGEPVPADAVRLLSLTIPLPLVP
jgi:hypothetical protein